jgi:hypothetical protein
VDEVVGHLHARERRADTVGVADVAADDLGVRADAAGERLRPAREAADALAALLERTQEATADVAGRAGEEDQAVDPASLEPAGSDGAVLVRVPQAEQRLVERMQERATIAAA